MKWHRLGWYQGLRETGRHPKRLENPESLNICLDSIKIPGCLPDIRVSSEIHTDMLMNLEVIDLDIGHINWIK